MVQGLKQACENRHEHQLVRSGCARRKTRETEVEKARRKPQNLTVGQLPHFREDKAGAWLQLDLRRSLPVFELGSTGVPAAGH